MKPQSNAPIRHVSDTASWVAHYRAIESERPDALFHDPLAKKLVGDLGRQIAESMRSTSKYIEWSVILRTCIIDAYIENLVREGVDTVINLGAGLDTRPYRMTLSKSLRWIEVDYSQLIDHKENLLQDETPRVFLERIRLDLSDRSARQKYFSQWAAESKKILIITEGVVPYLTEEQVAMLAQDLKMHSNFKFWVMEYFSPRVYGHLQSPARMRQMKNAPFVFFPKEWFSFFKEYGWKTHEIRYTPIESIKRGRRIPAPWWSYLIVPFIGKKNRQKLLEQTGYVLFTQI